MNQTHSAPLDHRSQTRTYPPPTLQMVSHAEVAEGSRRAPSITSRTRSKHHHRDRSHHGGTSRTPQNEFPFFAQTGDVEIVIACGGQENRYLLHRLILAQFSNFFEVDTGNGRARDLMIQAGSRPEQALSRIGEEDTTQHMPSIRPGQITTVSQSQQRWRYELDWENVEEDEVPILVKKTPQYSLFSPSPQPSSRPPATAPRSTSFFRSVANLALSNPHAAHPSQTTSDLPSTNPSSSVPILRDYDNLFRTFYSYAPNLSTSNIASAYSESKALLSLADLYDSLPVVGTRIDHHLLRFSSRLFKQIAKYPPSYLKLGYMARSRMIFSEALIHVVGQWPYALPYLKPPPLPSEPQGGYEVPQSVIDLIEDKHDDLQDLISKTEAKLFRLTLTTSRGERVNPSNDYLGWLAMSLFRQWLAENTTPEVRGILKTTAPRPGSNHSSTPHSRAPHPAPPQSTPFQPSRIFRLISSPNPSSYLPHDELKRFLKLHPSSSSSNHLYTRDNLKRFERKIDEIKNVARDIVKPLTRNCLELDLRLLSDGEGGGLGYLTCVKVEDEDLRWVWGEL